MVAIALEEQRRLQSQWFELGGCPRKDSRDRGLKFSEKPKRIQNLSNQKIRKTLAVRKNAGEKMREKENQQFCVVSAG